MSSVGVLRDLAEFFLPIGIIGGALAVLCAIVAGVALARGAAGLCGGSAAVWIGGAMMSVAAGFSGVWIPALASVIALAAGLVLGGVARTVMRVFEARPQPVPVSTVETNVVIPPMPPKPLRVNPLVVEKRADVAHV